MTSWEDNLLIGGFFDKMPVDAEPPVISTRMPVHRLGMACLAARHCAVDKRFLVGICGNPYWRDPMLATVAYENGHAEALLSAIKNRGEDYSTALGGRFACMVFDVHTGVFQALVDRFSQETLYWCESPQGLLCATRLQYLMAQPGVSTALSNQGIFHYAYFHMLPAPSTIYEGVFRLPAAHQIRRQQQDSHLSCYWLPNLSEPPATSTEDLRQSLMDSLSRGVMRACEVNSSGVGAFLSGGLDSSTVAGMLARHSPSHAPTFSIGFDVQGYDEMVYARVAARHFANQLHEYYVTPDDVASAVSEIAAFMPEPFGNSSALPALYCARVAREQGIDCLLGGDGGDELFAGNTRYDQRIFEVYKQVPSPLRGLLEALVRPLPPRGLLRKAQSYIAQANTPLPDRLQSYNFLHRFGLDTVFKADFLASIDANQPMTLQRTLYQRPTGEVSSLRRMLYQDWQQTLADNDLRKVIGMADLAGIQVGFPLLDDEVVELSLRVPSSLHIRGRQIRHFYREALRDFLPTEVLTKSKHGFGLPFGVWMRDHAPLQSLAYDSITDLGKRGYFRQAYLKELISRHRHEHAAYYGEALWVLMMLELWFKTHTQP